MHSWQPPSNRQIHQKKSIKNDSWQKEPLHWRQRHPNPTPSTHSILYHMVLPTNSEGVSYVNSHQGQLVLLPTWATQIGNKESVVLAQRHNKTYATFQLQILHCSGWREPKKAEIPQRFTEPAISVCEGGTFLSICPTGTLHAAAARKPRAWASTYPGPAILLQISSLFEQNRNSREQKCTLYLSRRTHCSLSPPPKIWKVNINKSFLKPVKMYSLCKCWSLRLKPQAWGTNRALWEVPSTQRTEMGRWELRIPWAQPQEASRCCKHANCSLTAHAKTQSN